MMQHLDAMKSVSMDQGRLRHQGFGRRLRDGSAKVEKASADHCAAPEQGGEGFFGSWRCERRRPRS